MPYVDLASAGQAMSEHFECLYLIDAKGSIERIGRLYFERPDRFIVIPEKTTRRRDRISVPGGPLPYYLEGARPCGLMAQNLPQAHPDLGLPAFPEWNDEQTLNFLMRYGSENAGNIIVGEQALDRYRSGVDTPPLIRANERRRYYPLLAEPAMSGRPPIPYLAGQSPKFCARIQQGKTITPVVVKFAQRGTPTGFQSCALLSSEFLASLVLRGNGFPTASTQIYESNDTDFLEVRRFDRTRAGGRRGVTSLESFDIGRYGYFDSWTARARRLHRDSLLSARDLERIATLDCFAALIGNTNRHLGHLSLYDNYNGPFTLAPCCGMAPTVFAPRDEELPQILFTPDGPTPENRAVWGRASGMAEVFWRLLSAHVWDQDFHAQAEQCLEAVQRLRALFSARAH